jgi:hypothetical protein
MPTLNELYAQNPGTQQAADAAVPAATMATAREAAGPSTISTRDAAASNAGSRDAQAAHASHTGYNAQAGTVADSELASTELNRITSQDSPLMQRAKAEAMRASNARGLGNSSIAVGAAQGEMVDRATPLAQQDAAAKRNQALVNQDAENRAREFGAGAENTAALRNAELETGVSTANAAEANEAARLNASLQTNTALANSDATNRANLTEAELMQRARELNANLGTNVSLANADATNRVGAQQAELTQRARELNTTQANEMRRTVLEQNAELNRQYLAGTQAMDLASIQGRYQQLISSNESASSLYESYFQSISAAMANEAVSPDRVAQYVRVQQAMLQSGLELMDSLNGLDLSVSMPGISVGGTPGGSSTIAPSTPVVSNPSGGAGAGPAVPNVNIDNTAGLTRLQAGGGIGGAITRALIASGFTHYDQNTDEMVNPTTGERRKR